MSDLIERLRGKWPAGGMRNVDGPKAADQLEAQQAEVARLREALGYMLRAWDREVGPDDDILLMVKDGAKIRSVQCARKALEQKP